MNIEIYNYLNLINYKLAKLYKNGLYNPFPINFEVPKEKFKERLFFSQIEINLPEIIFEERKKIKKYFKNSQKNIKKIKKNLKKSDFFDNFNQNFENYLNLRLKLTKCLLHDFKHQDFDESDALLQIYKLDPIFAEHLFDIFKEDCDIENVLFNLEDRYNLTYLEKRNLIEKKNKQKSKKALKELHDFAVKNEKNKEKTLKAKETVSKSKQSATSKTTQTKKTQKVVKQTTKSIEKNNIPKKSKITNKEI